MKNRNEFHPTPSMKLTLTCVCLSFAILACSLTNRVNGTLPSATPEVIQTFTPGVSVTPEKTRGTPATQPTPGAENCYQGSWEVNNISDVVTPILQADKIQDVQYTGSTGSLGITMTAAGKLTLQANQYHSLFSGKLGFIPVSIDVLINGSGSGDYRQDQNGSLLIANPDFSGIDFSVSAASVEIMPVTPLSNLLPALQGNTGGQAFALKTSCSGDNLSLDSGASTVPPLEFSRIHP